jgi:hypothetical protein
MWEMDRVRDAIRILGHAAHWGDDDARQLVQEIADELGDDWPDFEDEDEPDTTDHPDQASRQRRT